MPVRTISRRSNGVLTPYWSTVSAGVTFTPTLLSGLVLWWQKGVPGSGTSWTDQSGNSLAGTLTNGPTWDASGNVVLDGTNDYITRADNALFELSALTIHIRLYLGAIPGSGTYYSPVNRWDDSSSQRVWGIFIEPTGILRFDTSPDGSFYPGNKAVSSVNVAAATDYSMTCTTNGTTNKLYLDGVERASITNSNTGLITTTSRPLNVGLVTSFGGTTNQYANMKVAHVMLYNRVLTATEVLQLHNYSAG